MKSMKFLWMSLLILLFYAGYSGLDGVLHFRFNVVPPFLENPAHFGMGATALLWLIYVVISAVRREIPQAYRFTAPIASLVLLGSFALDGVTHSIWGIEKGFGASQSFSHLGILLGPSIFLLSPLFQLWKQDDNGKLEWTSALFFGWIIGIFLMSLLYHWITPFGVPWMGKSLAHIMGNYYDRDTRRYMPEELGVMRMTLSSMILTGSAFLFHKRWRHMPLGFWTTTLTVHALGPTMLLYGKWAMLPAAFIVGLFMDCAMEVMDPRESGNARLLSLFIPFILNLTALVFLGISEGIAWPLYLTAGSVVTALIWSFFVGLVAMPPGSGKKL